jgi:hypothetical protein
MVTVHEAAQRMVRELDAMLAKFRDLPATNPPHDPTRLLLARAAAKRMLGAESYDQAESLAELMEQYAEGLRELAAWIDAIEPPQERPREQLGPETP